MSKVTQTSYFQGLVHLLSKKSELILNAMSTVNAKEIKFITLKLRAISFDQGQYM